MSKIRPGFSPHRKATDAKKYITARLNSGGLSVSPFRLIKLSELNASGVFMGGVQSTRSAWVIWLVVLFGSS